MHDECSSKSCAGHPTLATPTTHEKQVSVESWYTAYFRQKYHGPKRAYIILMKENEDLLRPNR